ncbi:MAG TPA: TonB-dependent receptor, partial [Pyrinomonadaceae bacterium]|nr:TonB-dependent receptor [Pyrinomonadaceae bacterium]
LYIQRTNTARARIQGSEAAYEVNLPLRRTSALTFNGTMGWLKGSDLTPDPNALALINSFYNRSDTPVPLRGSATDAPLAGITPFRGIFAARYSDFRRGWFGEYEARRQSRVTRADPLELSSTITTQYGTLASLGSFTQQSARFGYDLRRESRRMLLTFGVENLTNRLYFEHFQNAPAPGRTFVLGLTVDLSNLWR